MIAQIEIVALALMETGGDGNTICIASHGRKLCVAKGLCYILAMTSMIATLVHGDSHHDFLRE